MRKVKIAVIQPEMIYKKAEEISMESVKKQLDTTFELLEKAGQQGCDIVCTCEDAASISDFTVNDDSIFNDYVEKSVPLIENTFSQIAKKYSMYIIGCYMKKQDSGIFNTASIFDREGKIIGAYRKTHLPANESWQVSAGDDLSVFTLDFGKIGICICYDMMFPEVVEVLSLKGAELIFHPTFGLNWNDEIGIATLRVRANDNGVHIATSKNYAGNAAGKSGIIDFWGNVLADAGYEKNVIASCEIDLDAKKQQEDWYFNVPISGEKEVTSRLQKERRPDLYSEICLENKKLRIPAEDEKQVIRQGIKSGEIHW